MIIKLISSQRYKQVFLIYLSTGINFIFSFLTSTIVAKSLGAKIFGDYRYIINVYTFTSLMVLFGVYTTGSLIIARENNIKEIKRTIGALISLGGFSFFVMILLILVYSFFSNNQIQFLIICSPLSFIFPFQNLVENILQGYNKINYLSLLKILPNFLIFTSLLVAIKFGYNSLFFFLVIYLSSFATTLLFIIYKLQPSFINNWFYIKKIFQKNSKFGIHIYIGSIFGVAFSTLGGITISYFYTNNLYVGLFSLAVFLTAPLTLITNALGNVFFRDFVNLQKIPLKVALATLIIPSIFFFSFSIVGKFFIIRFYGKDFIPAYSYFNIIAVGSILHGIGDFYNKFLCAKEKGKEVRNGAIITGIFGLLGNIFLVKFFGINGALITKLGVGFIYFCFMIYQYRKYTRTY